MTQELIAYQKRLDEINPKKNKDRADRREGVPQNKEEKMEFMKGVFTQLEKLHVKA